MLAVFALGEDRHAVIRPVVDLVVHASRQLVLAARIALADTQSQVVGWVDCQIGHIEGARPYAATLPADDPLKRHAACVEFALGADPSDGLGPGYAGNGHFPLEPIEGVAAVDAQEPLARVAPEPVGACAAECARGRCVHAEVNLRARAEGQREIDRGVAADRALTVFTAAGKGEVQSRAGHGRQAGFGQPIVRRIRDRRTGRGLAGGRAGVYGLADREGR